MIAHVLELRMQRLRDASQHNHAQHFAAALVRYGAAFVAEPGLRLLADTVREAAVGRGAEEHLAWQRIFAEFEPWLLSLCQESLYAHAGAATGAVRESAPALAWERLYLWISGSRSAIEETMSPCKQELLAALALCWTTPSVAGQLPVVVRADFLPRFATGLAKIADRPILEAMQTALDSFEAEIRRIDLKYAALPTNALSIIDSLAAASNGVPSRSHRHTQAFWLELSRGFSGEGAMDIPLHLGIVEGWHSWIMERLHSDDLIGVVVERYRQSRQLFANTKAEDVITDHRGHKRYNDEARFRDDLGDYLHMSGIQVWMELPLGNSRPDLLGEYQSSVSPVRGAFELKVLREGDKPSVIGDRIRSGLRQASTYALRANTQRAFLVLYWQANVDIDAPKQEYRDGLRVDIVIIDLRPSPFGRDGRGAFVWSDHVSPTGG